MEQEGSRPNKAAKALVWISAGLRSELKALTVSEQAVSGKQVTIAQLIERLIRPALNAAKEGNKGK